MLRCGVNRSTLEISGRASKLRLFSGGKCGVQRQTPWAQVFIYRKRGADRAESRRAYPPIVIPAIPKRTSVLVKISAGNDFFQAKAKIVYSQMNMGAGVVFQEFDQASRIVLERWMDEAKKEAVKQEG